MVRDMKLLFIIIICLFIPFINVGDDSIKINTNPYLILVNKSNPLDSNYIPSNLVLIKDVPTVNERYIIDYVYEAYKKLYKDSNMPYIVYSAYRSYLYQSACYSGNDLYSAKPGYSEHQTGLALDITINNVGLHPSFGYTDAGIWLNNNAYKYGFIIRYPKNKENITGYLYEPWHIRYVGINAAKDIYFNNITLEEYLK